MHRPLNRLDRFRAAVMEDAGLQARLGRATDWESFIGGRLATASALGIEFSADDLRPLERPDPLGTARFAPPPSAAPSRLVPGWLPMQVVGGEDGPAIDWIYFGDQRLTSPFYAGSLRAALQRPFNMTFRFRTPLSQLAAWSRGYPAVQPAGFIFHMSRCGSTLAAQMLAASARHDVLSEADPVDTALQLCGEDPGHPAAVSLLQAMIGAFDPARTGATCLFVKLEAWHALALPLFQRAFPNTPWTFLYRDPVEVLVSQMRQPGLQVAPPAVAANILSGASLEDTPRETWIAALLAAACDSAADAAAAGGGLLVNYDELPGAVWSRILPHFGVVCDAQEQAAMHAASARDAKTPSLTFSPDSEAKQLDASDKVRAACAALLDQPYGRLEQIRRAQGSPRAA